MSTQTKEKLWTGSFTKICLVNFFIFVNFHALLPTFPYFIEYLGGDSVAIGLATALFSLASIISRPLLGWLVDTKGRRIILVIGLIGMSLIPMGYFVAAGIAFSVILRTIHGAFHAASSNAASTWVADIIPRSRMGEGLGMYGLSMAISTAVAPALGLAIMNWQDSWNIAAFVGVLLLVLIPNVPCYLISALLLGYSFGAIQPSLQTMAMHAVAPNRRGAASSTFFIAFDLGIALGAFIAGVLVKYIGYDWMFICIAFSCVLSLVYYFFFGQNHESSLNSKTACCCN